MSSQVQQPFQTLELPPKSWPQIPWRADQRSASFQKPPLGSGMVAGFWVWILGGFLKMHGSAVWRLLRQIRLKSAPKIVEKSAPKSAKNPRQNPHPKSTPKSEPKSTPKICTKIRAQTLNQYPQRPTTKRAQAVVP